MKVFKLFLASPGDTSDQRVAAKEVIEEINTVFGRKEEFTIQLLNWEDSVYSSVGQDGQDVINRQIGEDYDIFVGIMWKKFGSPTKRFGSGTEEEFNIAYERLKNHGNLQLMFFFNSTSIPQDSDFNQFRKVQDFRKSLEDFGVLYKTFTTNEDFIKLFRSNLMGFILDNLKALRNQDNINNTLMFPELSESFKKYLNNMDARFAHSRADTLYLDDMYVAPDLKDLNSNQKRKGLGKTVNLDFLTDSNDNNSFKILLVGNNTSGKTASCKYLYLKYFNFGYFPVLLNGLDFDKILRVEVAIEIINKKIAEQYDNTFNISNIDKSKLLLIIDDFHKATKGKGKYWYTLLNNIECIACNIIVTGSTLVTFNDLNKNKPFANFDSYFILEFGPKNRNKLVEKWNSLGEDIRFIDKNEILRKNDSYNNFIKSIIGKNYIPAYPFYILSILQTIEGGNTLNPNYSIHGFYYELLINNSLSKAVKSNKEIGLYSNFLTQFCYYLFELKVKELSIEQFNGFYDFFCKKHDISYSKNLIMSTLDKSCLLCFENNRVFVNEKYVYYFFVAKFISNEIGNKEEIKSVVSKMCQRVFRDEYASILMFITHLSKDSFIITELIKNADIQFSSFEPTKLQTDVKHINELVKSMPSQVIEMVDVDHLREAQLEDEEEIEKIEKEFDNDNSVNYDDLSLDDDISSIDMIADITRALKTLDILGQVAKKNWGELEGDRKIEIVNSTYKLGLRTLSFYFDFIQRNSEEIAQSITHLIEKKNFRNRFNLKRGVEEEVKNFIFRLCFLSSYGVVKRISDSIGYNELKNTFEKVLHLNPDPSVKLIDFSIKLSFSSITLHLKNIKEFKEDLSDNKIGTMVLQNIVIDYLYMFDTDFQTKGTICNELGIRIRDQYDIDNTSKLKKN